MINFPTSLDTLTNPASNNTLDSPSHSGQHSDVNDAIEAIEAKVGADGSAVNTTHDFKLSGVSDGDYAASIGGTETLTNKTLTTPQINDTSANHQYVFASSELTADRTVTLPLLTGNDEFVFKDHTQTLTNKTIGTTNLISFNSPEGFLINGKIVPSVANNDLTVALKGLDGNDPSATNPVYCRIGDTVHAITAALSVTKADGTNWFNAGSAELATKEIDYFVYLGYNATDGVVIGFARIPYATQYDQFSATATEEKYCGISTITNAAAGDDYTVVGRFAATLSAGAGYTWTVPTFTTINLIQRPIYQTRPIEYLPTVTASGSMTISALSITTVSYIITGNMLDLNLVFTCTTGGSASNTISFSRPMNRSFGSRYAPFAVSVAESITLGTGTGSLEDGGCTVRKYDISNFGLGTNRQVRATIHYSI